MRILMPSYSGVTQIYKLRETLRGTLTLELDGDLENATIDEVSEALPKGDMILLDSMYPEIKERLIADGHNVVSGVIERS